MAKKRSKTYSTEFQFLIGKVQQAVGAETLEAVLEEGKNGKFQFLIGKVQPYDYSGLASTISNIVIKHYFADVKNSNTKKRKVNDHSDNTIYVEWCKENNYEVCANSWKLFEAMINAM